MDEHVLTLAVRWITGADTGRSSKCIWAVMMGQPRPTADYPYDMGDFGRCWRLLALIPAWRSRLGEMAEQYSEWRPLVREWEKLEAIYERGISTADEDERIAAGQEGYALLRALVDEIRHDAMPEVAK